MESERDAREMVCGRGGGVYNATIAGCDRSCELRAGNLGTVYANLSARRMRARGGEGNGMMGERARW